MLSTKCRFDNKSVQFVPDDHTAKTIQAAMEDMPDQWGPSPTKQVCITTDNGANMLKAVREPAVATTQLFWPQSELGNNQLHLDPIQIIP